MLRHRRHACDNAFFRADVGARTLSGMQRMKMGMRGAAASVLILAMGTSGVALSQQPAAPAAAKETATLNSPKQKLGYAIGLDVAKSVHPDCR
jgi:hypothetical protein